MPTALEMVVPLKIELKMGPNWRDMEPYEPQPAEARGKASKRKAPGRKRAKAKSS